MTLYRARRKAISYGHHIGILMLDCSSPFIPGDVGNAGTFPYPVLYEPMPGLTIERLIDKGDSSALDTVLKAARRLEDHGVSAITSDCGYMMHYQEAVVGAVSVPVMLSSLLQLPFVASLLGPRQSIGILCANAHQLTSSLLQKAFPAADRTLHIRGLQDRPNFRAPILDEDERLDDAAIEQEVVSTALQLVADEPTIACLLLECSNLPPYAHAVQRATGRPVFDFTTMINFMQAASARTPFLGRY